MSTNGNISVLLAICARNSPVTGEFLAQRPVTRSFDVFFDLRLNKQSWAGDLRRHRTHYDVIVIINKTQALITDLVLRLNQGLINAINSTHYCGGAHKSLRFPPTPYD